MKTSTALLLLSLLLTVSACTNQDESYTEILNDKRYQLDHVTKGITLSFAGVSPSLSTVERENLSEALQAPKSGGKSSVHVTLPVKTSGLIAARLAYLRKTLQELGIKKKQIHSSLTLKPQGNAIPIVLDIYRAIPTACIRQTGLAISNFGCTTAKNMILMVDDPLTLFQGTSPATSDPSREATAINHYRSGSGSSSGGGGSSSGGNQEDGSLSKVSNAGTTIMGTVSNSSTGGGAFSNGNSSGQNTVGGNAGSAY